MRLNLKKRNLKRLNFKKRNLKKCNLKECNLKRAGYTDANATRKTGEDGKKGSRRLPCLPVGARARCSICGGGDCREATSLPR